MKGSKQIPQIPSLSSITCTLVDVMGTAKLGLAPFPGDVGLGVRNSTAGDSKVLVASSCCSSGGMLRLTAVSKPLGILYMQVTGIEAKRNRE